jgi:hypothetical protein
LIQNYGGLVIPLEIQEQISKTDSGEPILKMKTFPVSCGQNFDTCIRAKSYQQLVPNSQHRSLAYFEQLGDVQRNTAEEKIAKRGSLYVYDIPVRLFVWLNVPKLNINGDQSGACSIAAPVILHIQKLLDKRAGFDLDPALYPGSSVQMLFQGQEAKEASRVLGRWSYGDVSRFMLFPFDWASLKYTVRLRLSPKCATAFTLGAAVDCAETL